MNHVRALRCAYVLSDYLLSLGAMILFSVIRYGFLPEGYEERGLDEWLFHDTFVLIGLIAYPLLNVLLYALMGFYNQVLEKSRLDIIRNGMGVSLITTIIIYFITLINDYLPERAHNYELLLVLWVLIGGMPVAGRLIISGFQRRRIRRHGGIYNAVVIGEDGDTAKIIDRLTPHNSHAVPTFRIVGTIAPDVSVDQLSKKADELNAQAWIVATDPSQGALTTELMNKLYPTGLSIYITPTIYHLISSKPRITNVVGEPLINISDSRLSEATLNFKRITDIVTSSLALLALSPIMVAIAVAVRLDSPGPAFYRQVRVGQHKRPFRIIKFRTMQRDAEQSGPALSRDDDPRITRVGHFLRKYRLDELPQFWNVLRGDMSLVGPRPEREFYVRQLVERVPQYSLVHQVRPGITSWGMVKYGYASTVEQMIERLPYDLIYLENISLGIDLKIMFHTIATVVRGKGK